MNLEYTKLTEQFKEWLHILGYSTDTVKSQPRVIEKYFLYLQENKITKLTDITKENTKIWYKTEKQRKSKQTGELLKNSTLNGLIRTLKLFSRFLEETNTGILTIDIPYEEKGPPERDILTKQEIRSIYNATDETILGLRDRAILSIYYGCGLRSKEGQYLEISDILFERKLLYVRKGKQYKERYVPFMPYQNTDFRLYLQECRPQLVNQNNTNNFFLLNNVGNKVNHSFLLKRIKELTEIAGIKKEIGLHTLRHSIATHLLQSGMKLEVISQFLGHKNIQSTQRYTHIANKDEGI